MQRQDNRETVEKANYPIQWIAGKKDSLIDFKKILRESHLSGINFVSLYTNSGHMSLIEQPDRLIADLRQFTSYCYSRNPSTE
jgi:pimeloyl-ACP methyl ester carboxylesterase